MLAGRRLQSPGAAKRRMGGGFFPADGGEGTRLALAESTNPPMTNERMTNGRRGQPPIGAGSRAATKCGLRARKPEWTVWTPWTVWTQMPNGAKPCADKRGTPHPASPRCAGRGETQARSSLAFDFCFQLSAFIPLRGAAPLQNAGFARSPPSPVSCSHSRCSTTVDCGPTLVTLPAATSDCVTRLRIRPGWPGAFSSKVLSALMLRAIR